MTALAAQERLRIPKQMNRIIELDHILKKQPGFSETYFNPGIDKSVISEQLGGLFPKLEFDSSIIKLFQWHNGNNNMIHKYPNNLIFGYYGLMSTFDIKHTVESSDSFDFRKNQLLPLFHNEEDRDFLCLKIIDNQISFQSPLNIFSIWNPAFMDGDIAYFKSLEIFFSYVIEVYSQSLIKFEKDGLSHDLDRIQVIEDKYSNNF